MPEPSQPTRDRLVAAGIRVQDELPLTKVFAGTTSAKVAATADVTTGSYFHHFRNAASFADAMALSVLNDHGTPPEVEDLVDALAHIDLAEVFRSALLDTWQIYTSDPDIARSLRTVMGLWAHHDQPLSQDYVIDDRPDDDVTVRTVGEIIALDYRRRNSDAVGGWNYLLERTGRTVLEPFTMDRIAVALSGMFDGLQVIHQVDPEAVDDELFADVAAALALAITVPRGGRVRLADLSGALLDDSHLSPQARSGARRRRTTRRRITEATTEMFDQGWERVSISEVAETADVSNQTVINLFGSVRGVAAATFARFVPALREAAGPMSGDTPPDVLRRVLTRLAECAAADPEAARALVGERLLAVSQRGGDLADMDIRLEVPLAETLLPIAYDLGMNALQATDAVASTINFVLAQSIGRPNQEARTADLALRMLIPDADPVWAGEGGDG